MAEATTSSTRHWASLSTAPSWQPQFSIARALFLTATLQDIEDLRRFEQGIIATERAFDPTLKAGRIQYYDIEAMLVAANVQFLVACGLARVDDAKPYLNHRQQAYLGLMYGKWQRQPKTAQLWQLKIAHIRLDW